MALKATVYKASIQVANLDENYYHNHNLTLACHPSETTARMMLRLLCFALYASDGLAFTRGISTHDEPDLWKLADNGDIELWIELGTPDEKRIRRACNRSGSVVIMSYGGNTADVWWQHNKGKLGNFKNLAVINITAEESSGLDNFCARGMDIQFTIQDSEVLVSDGQDSLDIHPVKLL